ncbi:HlyD family secretion protein [Klebsiella pneumoniae]|uniref:HlyD family secretion protein n=1 Tax=Klebsiella pneumoniae TaxID=573 RepID=A0A377TTW5_KLEPN|nr:HlyD family secretion protein [Klebsiella pneumoniae]
MSQQDAAKQQANTRNNIRVVSIFTAAAIGLVGVLGDPLRLATAAVHSS